MCHPAFDYDGRDKNTNSQTNVSIKYIAKTHWGVIEMKSAATRYDTYVLEYLINRWKRTWDR